jgi:hypothetical protein
VDLEGERAELNRAMNENFAISSEPSRNFVSVLIEFLEQKEQTSSKEQNKFRKELLEAHSGWGDERMNVYCPMVQKFMDPQTRRPAYLYALGTTAMAMLFRDESIGELFSPRNKWVHTQQPFPLLQIVTV